MTHILQRHRRARQVGHVHLDMQARLASLDPHRRRGQIVMAKTFYILGLALKRQAIRFQHQPRAVHARAGHFPMQRVIVILGRTAIRQQPRVKGKAAVGVDNRTARQRLLKAVTHGQPVAVETGVPNHLAVKGQHRHRAALVADAHRLYPGRIAEKLDVELGVLQQRGRRGVKLFPTERQTGFHGISSTKRPVCSACFL